MEKALHSYTMTSIVRATNQRNTPIIHNFDATTWSHNF